MVVFIKTSESFALPVSGMLDIVDMEGRLHGDEEHVSGWDLVYDNGFIEIDPELCGYTTFLGAAIPVAADNEANEDHPVDEGKT